MPTAPSLLSLQEHLGAVFAPYGPAEAGLELAQTFGAYELEYAALRRGVGLMTLPQRGLLRCTGRDVADFLHRLLTQDLRAAAPGSTRRAFLLNEQGRIQADLLVHLGSADTWLDLDRCDLPAARAALEKRLIADDVQLQDLSADYLCLALHGPNAPAVLAAAGAQASALSAPLLDTPGIHQVVTLCGYRGTLYRHDSTGAPGFHLWLPTAAAATIYERLLDASGFTLTPASPPAASPPPPSDPAAPRPTLRGRGQPVGWLAYNTARIEAGSPLFHIDFGPDSLPHETGLLSEAVSFKKGCYLGQEIVARMENLGHPRRVLVGLRGAADRLPLAGAQVFDSAATPAAAGAIIGAITSSTLSPLLGQIAIAFAMMKWGRHEPGTKVVAPAEGQLVPMTVQGLRFL